MDDATDGPGGAPIDPYPLDTVWQTLLVEPTFTLTAWLALPLEQRPGLIDLRPESDYYSRHINGATSLPYPFGVDRGISLAGLSSSRISLHVLPSPVLDHIH